MDRIYLVLVHFFIQRLQFPFQKFDRLVQENKHNAVLFVLRRESIISRILFLYLLKKYPTTATYISGKHEISELPEIIKKKGVALLFTLSKQRNERFNEEIASIKHLPDFCAYSTILLWTKRVRKHEQPSLFDYPFGFFKFFLLMFNYKNAQLILSEAILPESFAEEENPEAFFQDRIEKERLTIIGPRQLASNDLIQTILSDTAFAHKIQDLEPENKQVHKKAERYLKEIAANKTYSYLNRIVKILEWIWRKTSEGVYIDQEGVEKIRKTSKKGQIVYISNHRSHADYLLLGQILIKSNLDSPLTAAGINMNFFPFGRLFRRLGAYYIRRSFKGNPLYSAVFMKYLETMLIQGNSQKFFIEGGRSRTGKILKPKLGMLSMMLSVLREGKVKDLYIVPISVDYGKLFEGESYVNELRGKSKQAESIKSVFDSLKFLKRKQGVNYIQFGDPFSVQGYFKAHEVNILSVSEDRFHEITQLLGTKIINDINAVVTITPSAIVSTVLLSNPKRGIKHIDLLRATKMIYSYISKNKVRTPPIFDRFESAILNVMKNFIDSGYVRSVETKDTTIYRVNESSRLYLDYYKNNIIHLFLPIAFVSTVILNQEIVKEEHLLLEVNQLKQLFANEFIYPDSMWDKNAVMDILKYFSIVKEIRTINGSYIRSETKSTWLQLTHRIILNYIESYFVIAEYLLNKPLNISENEAVNVALEFGYTLYEVGGISMEESVSRESYSNALLYFKTAGFLFKRDDKITLNPGNTEKLTELKNKLENMM